MSRTPNVQQQNVIDDLENNIILFASAGTGKTFTVANRVANIIAKEKATAEEILCLTFTIKACKEMQEDILSYAGEKAKSVSVNTIHSFCYMLLLEENKRTGKTFGDLSVCDEIDQEEILRSILSARYPYWILEEKLNELGVSMPNLDEAKIVQIEGSDLLFYLVKDKIVDFKGDIYPIPTDKQFVRPQLLCPVCGEIYPLNGRSCANCGNEFVFSLSKRTFDMFGRRSALRALVSEIKHCREKQGFYTDDERSDNQRAFDYIKENKKDVYENLVSYYARYLGFTPDEEFESAMARFAGRLVIEYDEHLRLSNLVDFDDLIIQTNRYLADGERLAYWSQRYKYIIVDEMQDTSELEYSVFKKLFANNRIMLCGDFFQTIYGWRGSNPSVILDDYIHEFSAKIYMFSENYRSTKTLAAATFGYLQNTYPQFIGKYCPQTLTINSQAEGEKIACYAFSNREEEAWGIYKYLQAHKENSSVCIMARSNKYIAELFNYFQRFNDEQEEARQLSFFTVEENFNFFKKPVVKDLLAVLKLLVNPMDRVSMERLTDKYVKGVGIKGIEKLRNYNQTGVSIISFLDPQTYLFGDTYHRLIEAYQTGNIVIYDTETTGLDLSKDQIVQISAIKIDKNGEIIETLDLMVEPTVEISAAAYETHGFDLEYLRANNALTPLDALERFSRFVEGCVLVGHNNLAYDKPLVERQIKEYGSPPLSILAEYDTLTIAKQFYTDFPNYKLSTLCENFDVVNENAHNALSDITATGKCLVEMLKKRIIPTAMERVSILMKYRPKFEKIYAFIEEMRYRLANGEELVAYIAERLGLSKRYPTSADRAAIRDVIESLRPEKENRMGFLKEYLADAALSGSQMDVFIEKTNKIPIITVHQAKGCEFDTVILAGADDNHFPNYAAKLSGEEEEKKVFYVAITRAKERLILTRAQHSGKFNMQETPYFWMLPSEYVKVNHAWKNGT